MCYWRSSSIVQKPGYSWSTVPRVSSPVMSRLAQCVRIKVYSRLVVTRRAAGGWQVLSLTSSFVTCAACIRNAQDMTKAPLIKSISIRRLDMDVNHSTCQHHRGVSGVFIHIVESDLGLQDDRGAAYITSESLHAHAGHFDPAPNIVLACSSCIKA